jgi:hypothetical protein
LLALLIGFVVVSFAFVMNNGFVLVVLAVVVWIGEAGEWKNKLEN